jgi:hypothetical protein
MVRLLLSLVVVVASVFVCGAIDVPLCDRSYCSCPSPNGDIGDAVKVEDGSAIGCLCACGREEGEACSTDDHCALGTACAYPKDLTRSGYQLACTNRCALTTCGQYQRCSLDNNYQPVCNARSFDCDSTVDAKVDAMRGNTKETFPNKCFMANANYDLCVVDGAAALWSPIA